MFGAVSMLIPTAFEVGMGLPYYVTWVAFGHVVGVYSSDAAFAGLAIHTITAISIGVVLGVFLQNWNTEYKVRFQMVCFTGYSLVP
jgi:hypothetical protein